MRRGLTSFGLLSLIACGNPDEQSVTPISEKLSTLAFSPGHDRLFGVTYDATGSIYAAGVAADGIAATDDHASIIAKFNAQGELDPQWGDGGLVRRNLQVGTNGELARGIVVQSTGHVVISASIEHAGGDARDRDIAVARFNTDGSKDTRFGTDGIVVLDLNSGEAMGATGPIIVPDQVWGLSLAADDKLIVTGATKAPTRNDTDFAVIRLNADGSRDARFGNNGVFTLDINNLSASPRNATVLDDGSIIMSGYQRSAEGVVSPVLFKLTPNGTLDTRFGTNGVYNEVILRSVAEVYQAALHDGSFVTAGYGRDSASQSLDWLSIRVNGNGQRDTTYGNSGHVRIDLAGHNDNARSLAVLPDNRVVLAGGARNTADNLDGMLVFLTPDGQPDISVGDNGRRVVDLGGPNDFFWSVAVAPNKKSMVAVGLAGAGEGADDDAVLMVLPLQVELR